MKNIVTLFGLTIIALFYSFSSCAQQQPAVISNRQMFTYYKNSLSIDSVKAEQVLQIMLNYKAGIKQIGTDQLLTSENKCSKIKALIETKNRQLVAILTKQQQDIIIPSTERETPKSVAHKENN